MQNIRAADWIDRGWGPRRIHRRGRGIPRPAPHPLADDPLLHRWLVRCGLRTRVTCRFRGQLGNQLHQLAATISHARRTRAFAFIPDWAYRRVFDCRIPTGYSTEGMETFDEDRLGPGALGARRDVILFGNFQSMSYVEEPLVRRAVRFHPRLVQAVQEQYRDLLAPPTVSLHVRRGDTLPPGNPMRVLSSDYYDRALERFADISHVIVFSDDIPWCRQRFRGTRFHFIEGEENFVDLCLMSLCRHHIICNSTFSWWGAWLDPRPGAKVVSPRLWYEPDFARLESPDRHPPEWVLLDP